MSIKFRKSVFGSTLLISGCCIGAGILGLPLVSFSSGFFLSLIPLIISWSYMYLSGLMLLEIYIGEKKNINLTGLLKKTLGDRGKIIGAGLFLFLFYSILTAYLNASSIIIQDSIKSIFKIDISQTFTLIINGLLLFFIILFKTRKIDFINRFLVFIMFFFYLCLVGLGSFQVNLENFITSHNVNTIIYAMPVFIVSFGYQNLIPTISHYLNYDIKSIKSAIFRGTILSLIVYLIWNFIILGMISNKSLSMTESNTIFITRLFKYSSPMIMFLINNFAFFAIITSLLTVSLSFVNFLSDSSESQKNRAFYTACTIIPPRYFFSYRSKHFPSCS
ncbi:hypothetical protein LCGC14_1496710 [marine sediment metagenome]|uniref:Amino acid transporter transmembrane domain-containing protein n=1 Tax=marine sediment metagenome TaxID=412755 RepID=A0A0F9J587_9ZZZZ